MDEKKLHNYSFRVKDKPELERGESNYEWVEYEPGKFRLVKKEKDNE